MAGAIEYYCQTEAHKANVALFKEIAGRYNLRLHHVNKHMAPWHLYTVIGEGFAQYPQRIDFWPHKLKAMNTTAGTRAVTGYGDITTLLADAFGECGL